MPVYSLDILLPFFFIIAIVWGALEFTDIFKNKGVKMIIALVIGVFAITNDPAVAFINQALPFAIMLFVIIFFLGFITKPFLKKKRGEDVETDFTLLAIVAVLVLLYLAVQGTDILTFVTPGLSQVSQSDLISVIGVIIVVLIFLAVYKSWGKSES